MSEPSSPTRPKLRVPSEDGGVLLEPPVSQAPSVIAANRGIFSQAAHIELQGRTLGQLRSAARSELITSAFRYTSEFRPDIQLPSPELPLVVTGHQPDLFHPGVWAKNFAATRVASDVEGVAVNLVVDNDFCDAAQMRVPTRTNDRLRIGRIDIESRQPPQPWEERLIDSTSLSDLTKRVCAATDAFELPKPVASQFDLTDAPARLSDALTRLRSRQEQLRGLKNLELPISRLCQTESFLRFACHLLVNIQRFHAIHNQAIEDYRSRNRLKSKTHPVPELTSRDGWWETPFWSWREGDKVRRRLFAKQQDSKVLAISDGDRTIAELPLGPDMDACCAVEVLMQLSSAGERIRTRALTTTIFARLLFSDLFIHGIGGAKYDEMTDVILEDFYGVSPPAFMTVSATLRLLGDRATSATNQDLLSLKRQLRDLKFNAQTALENSENPTVTALVAEKMQLIAQQNSDADRSRWRYRRFRELNRLLAQATSSEQSELESRIESLQHELSENAVLNSRDFSFALFPPEKLDRLFARI